MNKKERHGMSRTVFYKIWRNMKDRCLRAANKYYKDYGGRGIKMCKRWQKFSNFRDDMYESYLKHKKKNTSTSIERIDNNGNYKPSNCTWATHKEQHNNQRNCNYVTFKGETLTIRQWSEKLNLNYWTLQGRITKYKWAFDRAVNTPIRPRRKRINGKLVSS